MQNRRTFIKNTCMVCMGVTAMDTLLNSCAGTQTIIRAQSQGKTLTIPLEKLKDLKSAVVRNKGLAFDILLIREKESFKALQMRCTHNDYPLTYAGKKITCNLHGSEFDLNGQVLKEPASRALTHYKAEVKENQLIIYL